MDVVNNARLAFPAKVFFLALRQFADVPLLGLDSPTFGSKLRENSLDVFCSYVVKMKEGLDRLQTQSLRNVEALHDIAHSAA